jgi:hypothetical protein
MRRPRTRDRADLAARLRQLADAVERNEHPIAQLGVPARGVGGGITVPAVVHDLLCGWRIRIRTDTTPPALACTGCGLTITNPQEQP